MKLVAPKEMVAAAQPTAQAALRAPAAAASPASKSERRGASAGGPSICGLLRRHSRQLRPPVLSRFLYFSLEQPQTRIGRAIGAEHLPQRNFGLARDRIPCLRLRCAVFLRLVFGSSAFDYSVNTRNGQLGGRMLRRFCHRLCHRMPGFPLGGFGSAASAWISPAIPVECEPLRNRRIVGGASSGNVFGRSPRHPSAPAIRQIS